MKIASDGQNDSAQRQQSKIKSQNSQNSNRRPLLLTQITEQCLTKYLKNFVTINDYKNIDQGKQLLSIISKQQNQDKIQMIIKLICCFFEHSKAEGKVCVLQFIKEVMDIGKIKIFLLIQKLMITYILQAVEFRNNVKTILRGSTFFAKQIDKNEKDPKMADLIRLANTYVRMNHQILFIWGTKYFPSSQFGTLYKKLSKYCTFPQYPSDFKFYRETKVEQNSKDIKFVNISNYVKEKKGGQGEFQIFQSKRSKQRKKDKLSKQKMQELNTSRKQKNTRQQNIQDKTVEIYDQSKIKKTIQQKSQKIEDKRQLQKTNTQKVIKSTQTKLENKFKTSAENIKLINDEQETKLMELYMQIPQQQQSQIYLKGSKIVSKPVKNSNKVPKNIIYRQSSVSDPVDLTNQIDDQQIKAQYLKHKKKQTIETPMGIITQVNTQDGSSNVKTNKNSQKNSIKEQSLSKTNESKNKQQKSKDLKQLVIENDNKRSIGVQKSNQLQLKQVIKQKTNQQQSQMSSERVAYDIPYSQQENDYQDQINSQNKQIHLNLMKPDDGSKKDQEKNNDKINKKTEDTKLLRKLDDQMISNEVAQKQREAQRQKINKLNYNFRENNRINQKLANNQKQIIKSVIGHNMPVTQLKNHKHEANLNQNFDSGKIEEKINKYSSQKMPSYKNPPQKNNMKPNSKDIQSKQEYQTLNKDDFKTSGKPKQKQSNRSSPRSQIVKDTKQDNIKQSHISKIEQKQQPTHNDLSIQSTQVRKKLPYQSAKTPKRQIQSKSTKNATMWYNDQIQNNQDVYAIEQTKMEGLKQHQSKRGFRKKMSFNKIFDIKQLCKGIQKNQQNTNKLNDIQKSRKRSIQQKLRKFRCIGVSLIPDQNKVLQQAEQKLSKRQQNQIKQIKSQIILLQQRIQQKNIDSLAQIRKLLQEQQEKISKSTSVAIQNQSNKKLRQFFGIVDSNQNCSETKPHWRQKNRERSNSKRSSMSDIKNLTKCSYQQGTMLYYMNRRKSLYL